MAFAKSSRRSARSDVVDAETWADSLPSGARNSFSGEMDGAVARPPFPSGTSQSRANSAAPRRSGQAKSRSHSASRVKA